MKEKNILELARRMNLISIDDMCKYTITQLVVMIANKVNELIDEVGGFESEVQHNIQYLLGEGLHQEVVDVFDRWIEDGTIDTLINQSALKKVNDLIKETNEQLNDVVDSIPYSEYNRELEVDYDGNYSNFQGFSNFSKKTYGRYEQGTVMSVIANVDNPRPELTGTDTQGLATYTNRDSCSLYVANSGRLPLYDFARNQVTYTDNGCILPNGTDMKLIKVGMILDSGTSVNSDWYVGIVKEIEGNALTLEDGWWMVRNDGTEPTKGTPKTGSPLKINQNNKIWNINSNMFVNHGIPAGANMELGVFCDHSDINDVGGIDLINLGSHQVHYGVKVRGKTKGFNEGFISDGNGRHFVGWTDNSQLSTVPVVASFSSTDKTEKFSIMSNGLMKGQKVDWVVASTSLEVGYGKSLVIVTGDGVNVSLPKGEGGRTIKIITLKTDTLVTAPDGMGVITVDLNQQQISIGKTTGKQMRVVELFSDGGSWYVLNDEK